MIKRWLAALLAALEKWSKAQVITPAPLPDPPPIEPPAVVGADDLDLKRVTGMIVCNSPGVTASRLIGARVTATITSASTDGNKLVTHYGPYSYPEHTGENGRTIDAITYFFYEIGAGLIGGGKFDWWAKGGQGTKGLENVHAGYGGHKMPAPGTPCWTMFSSTDGSQRSNTCKVVWK